MTEGNYQIKRGHPDKLTDELMKEVCECLENCMSILGTCRYVDIDESTWYKWKKRATTDKDNPINEKYVDFFRMVEHAQGIGEKRMLGQLIGFENPHVTHSLFKRRYNKSWGDKQKIEIEEQATVKHDFSGLSFEEKKELIKQLVLEEKETKEPNDDTQ